MEKRLTKRFENGYKFKIRCLAEWPILQNLRAVRYMAAPYSTNSANAAFIPGNLTRNLLGSVLFQYFRDCHGLAGRQIEMDRCAFERGCEASLA